MSERTIRSQIESEIAWYDAKASAMDSRSQVLALAVCIGATKALRDILGKLPAPPTKGTEHE